MSWLILCIAGILEAGWLVAIQKSESFTKIPFVLLAVISMSLSLILFSISLKEIPIAQAYLVWLAIGVVSISVVNHFFFEQSISLQQMLCFCLIFVGIVGLKLSN